MATISEDYVSFEVAKLLKEKGFDSDEVGCHGGFYSERCYESGHGIKTQSGQEVGIVYDDLTNSELEHDEYLRPTLQMVMKWLREKYNIHIIIETTTAWFGMAMGGEYRMVFRPRIEEWNFNPPRGHGFPDKRFCSYEEAAETAIKHCLENLI